MTPPAATSAPSRTDEITRIADEVFGWPELREGIHDAIAEVLDGHDVLAVMPTGYGKSAMYKVAGALLPGLTVVVSPLIALQADQIAGIRDRDNAHRARALNSSQRRSLTDEAWQLVEDGGPGYLFLAPEQLTRDEVLTRLKKAGVSLFVVDEAHCVSSWGHDFRPDYLRLGEIVEALGSPPILAMTATGPAPVREEIERRLRMRKPVSFIRGFDRPEIRLEVVRHGEESEQRDAILDDATSLEGPGIVFTATRVDAEEIAEELVGRGVGAVAYHAGLRAKERSSISGRFHDGEIDVIVATSAFGMGIDKSDIRFVVHAAVPESLDAYYQEAGRAGRDGEAALARLHYRSEDLGLRKFFASGKPNKKRIERLVTALRSADRPVTPSELAEAVDLSQRQIGASLGLLLDSGAVRQSGESLESQATVKDAIEAVEQTGEQREAIDESRIAMMRSYAETDECRRLFLLGYFGEVREGPCGNCDTCTSGTAMEERNSTALDSDSPFPNGTAVKHSEWGVGTVMRVEDDRITVFFESEGYRVLSVDLVVEKELLTLV